MSQRTAYEIAHFLPIYYKLLQDFGRYLNDVEYENLRSPAQHKILTEAHNLWVNNLSNTNAGGDGGQLMAYTFIKKLVLENEQQKETIEELRGIIASLTVI